MTSFSIGLFFADKDKLHFDKFETAEKVSITYSTNRKVIRARDKFVLRSKM